MYIMVYAKFSSPTVLIMFFLLSHQRNVELLKVQEVTIIRLAPTIHKVLQIVQMHRLNQ